MAIDVITGKKFDPKFKGQRTASTVTDEASLKAELEKLYGKAASNRPASADGDWLPNPLTGTMNVDGQDVWYVNGERMTDAGLDDKLTMALAQLQGGGPGNPFWRTEAGLEAWRPMNMGLADTSYYQGLDDAAREALNFNPETGFYAGGVQQINDATYVHDPWRNVGDIFSSEPAVATAPAASTRQTTSVTQPAAAATAAAEVDPAIAQREIIEKALAAKLKPIQNALAAGLLDVQAAQLAWDSARSEIYGDFLTEQTGVQQGFRTQQEADEAKRLAGRTKLLQDLNAAGVDSGMVADELALIDAIAEGSGQERMGLIGDIGRIGLMSNADRRMMGEGIFGGYEQDLRSQARQATLAAELDAAGQIQTAEERALSAGRLSDYMGIPVEALMADLYSDIDLTGMATRREEMDWGTSERLGSQEWQTGEREGAQTWQTGERTGAQTWQEGENALDRVINQQLADVSTDQLAEQIRQFGITTPTTTGADGVERMVGFDEATGLTAAQTQEQANWLANMIAQGIDMSEGGTGRAYGFDTATGLTAGQKAEFAAAGINPATGRPYGFDTATGLTAGQTQDQSNWLANMIASGIDMSEGGTGRAIGFNEQTGLTAAQTQDQANYEMGLLGQGIDMRQTITRPNYQTGAMETVANPNYGRPYGFDASTGMTGVETQAQQNWQSSFDQSADQWLASMVAQGYDMSEGGTGQAIGFDPTTGLTAAERLSQSNFMLGLQAQGVDTRQTILQTDPQTGYMRTVPNPNYGRPVGFDPETGLTAGEQLTQSNWQTEQDFQQDMFDASQLGVDTKKWAHDAEGRLIPNPTYGMSPTEQADYAMDLWSMTQTDPEATTATGRLMNYLSQLGDPAFTASVMKDMGEKIDNNISIASKGLSETNVLWALGALANTQGEPDAQGNPTYPYRDMFNIVQQGSGATGAGDGTTGGGGFVHPGAVGVEDENLTAVADAAAAAGGGGPSFIPGGGEFGMETTVAPLPAGQQPGNASQDRWYYEEGSPISFYLNDGRPVYTDADGKYYVMRGASEKYVAEGDKAWEFSYRRVPQRVYQGDEHRFSTRWPAGQEWPNPIRQE